MRGLWTGEAVYSPPAAWAASVRSIVYRLQRRVRDGFSPSSVTCAGTQWITERDLPQEKCI